MSLNFDPVVTLNLVLALGITILGVWIYRKRREEIALYVALGFGLFAISHALTILGYGEIDSLILPVRAAGYLVVILGLALSLLRAAKTSVARRVEPEKLASQRLE